MAVSNMNLIRALVSQLRETQALACGGGGGGGGGDGGDGVRTKTIISPKFQISGFCEYGIGYQCTDKALSDVYLNQRTL